MDRKNEINENIGENLSPLFALLYCAACLFEWLKISKSHCNLFTSSESQRIPYLSLFTLFGVGLELLSYV